MKLFKRIMDKKYGQTPSSSPNPASSSSSSSSSDTFYDCHSDLDNNSEAIPAVSREEERIADRVREIVHYVDPHPSPISPFTLPDCPSFTSLASVNNSPMTPQSPIPMIGSGEHWPLTEIRQLRHIIVPCVRDGMTACELGIFLVKTMYHRDRFLGGALTVLVDAGNTYAVIGQSMVRYLCILSDRGTSLSEDLVLGDATAKPVRPSQQQALNAPKSVTKRRPVPNTSATRAQPVRSQKKQRAPASSDAESSSIRSPRSHRPTLIRNAIAAWSRHLGDSQPEPVAQPYYDRTSRRRTISQTRWPFLDDGSDEDEAGFFNCANNRDILRDPFADDLSITNANNRSNNQQSPCQVDLSTLTADNVSFSVYANHVSVPLPPSDARPPRQRQQQTPPVAPINRPGYDVNERNRRHRGVVGWPNTQVPPGLDPTRTIGGYDLLAQYRHASNPQVLPGPARTLGDHDRETQNHETELELVRAMLNINPWSFLDEYNQRLNDYHGDSWVDFFFFSFASLPSWEVSCTLMKCHLFFVELFVC